MEFKDYLYNQLEKNYLQFYPTQEDFVKHLESGEVKIPYSEIIKFQEKFNKLKTWNIISWCGNSMSLESVQRTKDNKIFKLDDFVTNGSEMRGLIQKFEHDLRSDNIYVYTDWSNIGMLLDECYHLEKLPSRFQIGQYVSIKNEQFNIKKAKIIKINFTGNKVTYDLLICFDDKTTTKIFNVDSYYVSPLK